MAPLSEADVCNLALIAVGEKQTITRLDENNEPAILCRVLYGPARDEVLAKYAWTFATRRSVLAQTTEERTDWLYTYALPADYLGSPVIIVDGARLSPENSRNPFKIELNDAGNGRLLLTDLDSVEFSYTARQERVPLFSPLFVKALALKLAAELAMALPVKPQLGIALDRQYQMKLIEARATDASAEQKDAPVESPAVTVR